MGDIYTVEYYSPLKAQHFFIKWMDVESIMLNATSQMSYALPIMGNLKKSGKKVEWRLN